MGAKTEQAALCQKLRNDGATWAQVVGELRTRWGLNARQVLRIARGLSQDHVVAEWNLRWPNDPKSAGNISKWERWPTSASGHMPSLVVLDRLARIYRCSVADLVSDFHDHSRRGDDDGVDRRTLIGALGASLVTRPLRPQKVAPEIAAYFEGQLRSHYRADMLAGPHLVVDTVTAQYGAICQAIAVTTGQLHKELLRVAASYAALAGWLHQDAGDLAKSTAWRSETLDMAHRADDAQLVSYALTNKAMLQVEIGDGTGAVDFATAALADARTLAPKVRIVALVQAAHGHSLIGQRDDVDRSLDAMADMTDQANDDWPWANAFRRTPGYVDVQRATCYGRLGLAAEAAELWGTVIRQQPNSHRRDGGVYLARYASALLSAGEPHEATDRATQAIECLHETGSARMRLELARLQDQARRWDRTAVGRDLVRLLRDIS